jgi:anti-sigma regulatory factor (Ser/Thr protein kinase)
MVNQQNTGAGEVTKASMLLLPFAPSSAGIARRHLVSDLVAAGIFEAAISDAAIVVSELFSNALRHARPLPGAMIRVCWQLEDATIRVSVEDGGGATEPELGELSQSTTNGRGLRIVDRLARHWGTDHNEGGTTVWAEIPSRKVSVPA